MAISAYISESDRVCILTPESLELGSALADVISDHSSSLMCIEELVITNLVLLYLHKSIPIS